MDRRTILIAEDDAGLGEALETTLRQAGFDTLLATDGEQALQLADATAISLLLSDVQMQPMDGLQLLQACRQRYPGVPVVLMTAYATVSKAVSAMKAGAHSYLVKPFVAEDLIEVVEQCLLERPTVSTDTVVSHDVVCGDPNTLSMLSIAARVAESEATVLLAGESGCGKEVFARYLHKNSPRAKAPFVAINCAAIPDTMLEATLFGYSKGAFTGAAEACAGKFEQANGGTILLDEISEMDIGLQAKLLRVLQEREVERLGSKKTIALNVRVLATTNRNLSAAVEAGEFREDLYYRLNVFPLYIPPLRERRGDVLPLVQHMLTRYCSGQRAMPTLTPMAEKRLLQHSWPGNVRELENVIQRTLILLNRDTISEADIVFEAQRQPAVATTTAEEDSTTDLSNDLRHEERRLINNALRAGCGNRELAARALGISPRTLRYKIARLRDAGMPVAEDFASNHRNQSVPSVA